MADRSYKLTLSLSDGSTIIAGTITAPQGPNGTNGATFIPSVSAAGVLSWTNNGGLTNPSPINIKGPKGDDAVITASDVENWGFTKNKGTVTSVAVKINGTIKGTVTSSGTIDLGTVLTEHQDISGKANLSGGNTFTGKQTLNSPGSDGYSINAAGYVKGSWLQASAIANKGANTGKVCVFDNSGWIYYRTPSEILAEAGGAKASDIPTNYVNTNTAQDIDGIKSFYKTSIFKNGMQLGDGNKLYGASDVSNIENYMPQKDGTLAVLEDIPEIVQKSKLSAPNAKVPMAGKWINKTWGGYSNFGASIDIWTDGDYIYASNGKTHYKLDKATSTWRITSWKGLTSFFGDRVWTDGNNIYYSNGNEQYVLNKSTSTWSTKTWNGLTNFKGYNVWTDGNNIYYSNGNEQYVLNKSTSTWSTKTWNGLTNFKGDNVWTDGNNIYYSNTTSAQYVLNKTTSTWVVKSWKGYNNIQGEFVWTDGDNIYYSIGSSHYVLDIALSTWNSKTWNGTNSNQVYGSLIWTDGDNIYCSNGHSLQLQLVKSTTPNKTSINSDIKNIYTPITKIIGSNGTYVADSSGSVTLPSDSVASVVDLTGSLIGGEVYTVFYDGETGSFTGIIDCEYNTSAGDFQFEMNSKILTCTPASDGITLRVTIDRMYNGYIYYYYYTVVANDNSINTSGFFTDNNTDMYISTNMGSSYSQYGVGTIITKVV